MTRAGRRADLRERLFPCGEADTSSCLPLHLGAMSVRVYIIRHGETHENAKHIIQVCALAAGS